MAAVVGFGVGAGIFKLSNQDKNQDMSSIWRSMSIGTIVDAIAAPTLIALGILGALGVVALSPAASYVMIGVGAGCALPHLVAFVEGTINSANPLQTHKTIFKEAWGSEQA